MAATFTFNKVTKIIEVDLPDTSVSIQEIYDACKDFEGRIYNLEIDKIADGAGKQSLTATKLVGITLTLIDWKLKFADRGAWTLCRITDGNLVRFDTGTQQYGSAIEPAAYVNVEDEKDVSAALIAGSGSPWSPAEKNEVMGELDAIKIETDKVPNIKTETDKIPNVKTEADKIQPDIIDSKDDYKANVSPLAVEEGGRLQSVNTETDKIAGVKTETDKIPNIKSETDKIQGVKDDVATVDANVLSILSDTGFVKDIEGGKWSIVGDEMIFYKSDNVTEIMRFTITRDIEGNPIMRTRQ